MPKARLREFDCAETAVQRIEQDVVRFIGERLARAFDDHFPELLGGDVVVIRRARRAACFDRKGFYPGAGIPAICIHQTPAALTGRGVMTITPSGDVFRPRRVGTVRSLKSFAKFHLLAFGRNLARLREAAGLT